jgi:zinc/manganese transport system ATP-binding protein
VATGHVVALGGGEPLVPARPAGSGSEEVLAVEGVTVWLSGRRVLDDVSFRISPGELVALIGANGAGKTTLLKVILGLIPPAAGKVLVVGGSQARRPGLVGYVPQKLELDPDIPLRARDLVGLGLDGHRYGIPRRSAARSRLVGEMLGAVEATRFADARVGQLSGGELQRVLIAHALIGRPKLLLLDEPLANLDLRSEQEVVALLVRISAEQGVAILIATHDMNPLLGLMSQVVYLVGGRAVSGTAEEVIRTETLSALYGRHVDVIRVHDRVLVVAGREDLACEEGHASLLSGQG